MARKKKKKANGKSKNGGRFTEQILSVFQSNPTQLLNYKQVSTKLGVRKTSARKIVNQLLYELAIQGKLKEETPGRFRLEGEHLPVVTGRIDMTSHGTAYLLSETEEEDIYLSEHNVGQALHGDLVEVSVLKVKKSGQRVGKVAKILDRAKSRFPGIVEIHKTYAFLIPDDRKMATDIFIPLERLGKAENGMKAIAKITDWPEDAKNPFGEIVEVLGKPGENNTEMHAILAEYGLPSAFPAHVEATAQKLNTEVTEKEIKKRRDFREITTFTIDPHDAKDFDDALSIREIAEDRWEIGVHIADVTYYLEEGSALDKEAYERATSVYLVDRVVPMLPEVLSNFACSLRPKEEKYCFSAVFELNAKGKILSEWFGRTVIYSDHRFTYEEAQEILDKKEGEYSAELLTLNTIAKALRAERFKKGSIDFSQSEVRFQLSEEGEPTGVFIKQQKDAHRLIEDFMLLANRRVASFIGEKQKQKRPFVYRVHDAPNPEKLLQFSTFIKKLGYRMNSSNPSNVSGPLNQLLSDVQGQPEQELVTQLAIRTMAKAVYDVKNVGHYGLGFRFYTHFTSPIRRYPDVMVHRLLQYYMDGGSPVNEQTLEESCKHCSEREKLATDAERTSIKWMQVKFMQDKIGQAFEGIVSGVSEWGVYVEIKGLKCEGLIRLRNFTDDYYSFDEDNFCVKGRRYGNTYRIGDEIDIRVIKADLLKKQLDFEPADF